MSYAARRRRLARQLKPLGLDALLVTHPVNVTYLTGFTGDSSFLVVGRQRQLLVSDHRFTEQLAEECPGLAVHFRPPRRRRGALGPGARPADRAHRRLGRLAAAGLGGRRDVLQKRLDTVAGDS